MNNKWVSDKTGQTKNTTASKTGSGKSSPRKTKLSADQFIERILEISEEIDEGLAASAEETILHIRDSHELNLHQQAKLDALYSMTQEIRGRYREGLGVLERYSDGKSFKNLDPDARLLVKNQLAVSLNNAEKSPEARSLIGDALEEAEEEDLEDYRAALYLTSARINKKLGEIEDAVADAETALDHFRNIADSRGMARAYYQLGSLSLLNGRQKKALNYFNLATQMVGEDPDPVILGRVFADMASVHWSLQQPKEGIECLEKSIEYLTQTENQLQLIFAYNDLGVSLMLLGDWVGAENAIDTSLGIAEEIEHPHIAGIYDSLGELKLLKGEIEEAAELLGRGIEIAREQENDWYLIQNLRGLARAKLAQDNPDGAIETANEALEIGKRIGELEFTNLIRLILAEAYLENDQPAKCEKELEAIEADDPETDFFVFGNIPRIRGLMAYRSGDQKSAVNHFRKSLTIFEAREDLYHIALLHFLLGETFSGSDSKEAAAHFVKASEIFRKLGIKKLYLGAEKKIEGLADQKVKTGKTESANTQLLMQRLAEATASRELLLRELVAILQQESKASRMIVVETGGEKGFRPYLTHGYTPVESNQIVKELQEAVGSADLTRFAKTKNAKVYSLLPPNAPAAYLYIFPKYTAALENGGDIEPLLRIVELGMEVCELRLHDGDVRVEKDANPLISQSMMPGFIHSSPAMTALVEEVYSIRDSDVTVLITGESGTGKELVSRAIHRVSSRKDKVFVPFNCTAVPKELTEGHLFGYKRGAFTGAANDSPGMIRTADGGTLLLDEIGDLPIDVQPKLLRFLQEGEIQPLGEKRPFKVDVRVIAATNMDLEEKVKQGLFREDLFYRINVVRLRVPSLRERRSEIKPMVKYYINHYSSRFNKEGITIKPQTIDLLMVSDWEGNVRQLCNEIQRIVARAKDGEVITPDHISPELKKKPVQKTFDESGNVKPILSNTGSAGMFSVGIDGTTIEEAVSELETQMILDSMRRNDGNITRVAKELGLTRRGLYMKIDRYGIKRAS